jgi:hypothetical protein
MEQMGHTDPALALAIYAKVVERKRDTGARMDALVRDADLGTNGHKPGFARRFGVERGNRKAAVASGFLKLRDKDSNLDYRIQSPASYR